MTGAGPQTTWVTSDLDKWGWTAVDTTNEEGEELDFSEDGHVPLQSILEQLGISTVLSGEDRGPNYRIAMSHNKEAEIDGKAYYASSCYPCVLEN